MKTLHAFFLNEKSAGYAWHRLRYFLATSLIKLVLFWAELLLYYWFIPQVIPIRFALHLAERFWWGALEEMRTAVRNEKIDAAEKIIGYWLLLAGCLAVVSLSGGIFFLATQEISVIKLYIGITPLQFALSLIVRTYHSGLYARRRIHRPLWSLLTAPCAAAFLLALCWPLIGAWAIPWISLFSSCLSAVLTIQFTKRQYERYPMRPRLQSLELPTLQWKGVLLGGLSYAVMGLGLFATLFLRLSHSQELSMLAFAALHLSFDWVQLYYFDYKRIFHSPLWHLKKRFTHLSFYTAIAMGLFSAILYLLITIPRIGFQPPFHGGIVCFALLQAYFAYKQMELFCYRRYLILLLSEAWVAALFIHPLLGGICAVFSLVVMHCCSKAHRRRQPGQVLSLLDWVQALPKNARVVRIDLLPQSTSEQIDQIASHLLGTSVAMTYLTKHTILWVEKKEEPLEHLSILTGGLLKNIERGSWQEVHQGLTNRSQKLDLSTLKKTFLETVPAELGFILDPSEKKGTVIESSYRKGLDFLSYLRPSSWKGHELTAFLDPITQKELIFGIQKQAPKAVRLRWRRFITDANIHHFLG